MRHQTLLRLVLPALLSVTFCLSISCQKENDESKYTESLLKVGTLAPDFTLTSSKNEEIKLSDYKGKYVVLDFWASWCPDCQADTPNIVNAYQQFKDKGISFIGISFDTDKTTWTNAIAKYNIEYAQVSELKKWKETKISGVYHIQWIPTMYLVNPEGKIELATIHSEELIQKLSEITK